MVRVLLLAALAGLAGCASVNANVSAQDEALAAVQGARVRECPPERTQAVGIVGVLGHCELVDLGRAR